VETNDRNNLWGRWTIVGSKSTPIQQLLSLLLSQLPERVETILFTQGSGVDLVDRSSPFLPSLLLFLCGLERRSVRKHCG
jgi:hypothetical protein